MVGAGRIKLRRVGAGQGRAAGRDAVAGGVQYLARRTARLEWPTPNAAPKHVGRAGVGRRRASGGRRADRHAAGLALAAARVRSARAETASASATVGRAAAAAGAKPRRSTRRSTPRLKVAIVFAGP